MSISLRRVKLSPEEACRGDSVSVSAPYTDLLRRPKDEGSARGKGSGDPTRMSDLRWQLSLEMMIR